MAKVTGKEVTDYSLPAAVSSEQQPDPPEVRKFKADLIATKDGVIQLIKRNVWGASPSKEELTRLKHPVRYVIFTHTASIGSYSSTQDCIQACKQSQDLNMSWGWSDIAYNFLVGNDGAIYEGRGWDYEGATAKDWNAKSIGIAFIGKYVNKLPSEDAMDGIKSFLQYLVDTGILSKDFTIYCLRQVRDFPEAPGDRLYANIKTWHGTGCNTWSWREFPEDSNKVIDQHKKESQQDCDREPQSNESTLEKGTGGHLLKPLEHKIDTMEATIKRQIDEAKQEILNATGRSGKERRQDLELLEERLAQNVQQLASESAAVRNHEFKQSCIRKHFTIFLEYIDPSAVLDYLYQELFTYDEYERIRNQETTMDKNRMLLVYVDRKGEEGVQVLQAALKRSETFQYLCSLLEDKV